MKPQRKYKDTPGRLHAITVLYHNPADTGDGDHGWKFKWCHNRRECRTRARLNGIDLMRDVVHWYWGPEDCICVGCGEFIKLKLYRRI